MSQKETKPKMVKNQAKTLKKLVNNRKQIEISNSFFSTKIELLCTTHHQKKKNQKPK